MEYYKRLEPYGELRNQGIEIPEDLSRNIIHLTGAASTAFWTVLLMEKSTSSIANVNALYLAKEKEQEPFD